MPDNKKPGDPAGAFGERDPKDYAPKIGVKKPAGQQPMFEAKPRRQTPQEFQQRVQEVEDNKAGYKSRAADLFLQFKKAMADKTLPQNRNILNAETERELMQNMIQLAIEINNDPAEENEGMGSLTWITLLLKTCLSQRDRLNEMEYAFSLLQKRLDSSALADFVNKEISKALDKKKENG